MKLIFLAISFFLALSVNSQSRLEIQKSLLNENFKFTLLRTSLKFIDSATIKPAEVLVVPEISRNRKSKIERLKKEDWLKLLSNSENDWAANLFLYSIYKRDASTFQVIKDRESWVSCCKDEDIAYWKAHLK